MRTFNGLGWRVFKFMVSRFFTSLQCGLFQPLIILGTIVGVRKYEGLPVDEILIWAVNILIVVTLAVFGYVLYSDRDEF